LMVPGLMSCTLMPILLKHTLPGARRRVFPVSRRSSNVPHAGCHLHRESTKTRFHTKGLDDILQCGNIVFGRGHSAQPSITLRKL
ncbi:MAG: hypothetical protein ABL893_17795, partial [Hyphomicrobium sp.]